MSKNLYTEDIEAVTAPVEAVEDTSDEARALAHTPCKEIAEAYVGSLLAENILQVTKAHIKIMNLVIPKERLVYFHIALSVLRLNEPNKQNVKGYSIEPKLLVSGNDTFPGYSITSNVEGEGSILITRKLATELVEVLAFFIPVLDTDNAEAVE